MGPRVRGDDSQNHARQNNEPWSSDTGLRGRFGFGLAASSSAAADSSADTGAIKRSSSLSTRFTSVETSCQAKVPIGGGTSSERAASVSTSLVSSQSSN